jgi:hypothetical protein
MPYDRSFDSRAAAFEYQREFYCKQSAEAEMKKQDPRVLN